MKTIKNFLLININVIFYTGLCECASSWKYESQSRIFAWKQLGYEIDRIQYFNSTNNKYDRHAIIFPEDQDSKKFFIQPNNVPIGLEVYQDRAFVTVPRRRYGIPSTLNYVTIPPSAGATFCRSQDPLLKNYGDPDATKPLVSVYRPRVDACDRLWMVDTGHLEVPGVRQQLQPPSIVIYDLKTNKEILNVDLDPSILVNERSSAGLTSITVDVDPTACDDAYAYINDLATEGLIVFSLKTRESWRLDHPSFKHDEQAMNFTATGHVLNWRDGLFSIALSEPLKDGSRTAYFHPMVSTLEFSVNTAVLKNKTANLDGHIKVVGDRGPLSQSGTHSYHQHSGVIFYANLPRDGIACWNVDTPLTPDNYLLVAKDPQELGYISDLKVSGDYVWVLANGIPKFVYNTQRINEVNYYIKRYSVQELIEGTACDARNLYLILN